MSKKFKVCETEIYKVYNLLNDSREGLFNLNRDYQRGSVWSKEKQESYIYNLLRIGLNPSPILLNRDPNGIRHCIDGKQRLTAIRKFSDNEMCCVDKEKRELIFYSKVPRSHIILVSSLDYDDYETRILDNNEMRALKGEKLFVVTYDNLTYDEEIDVFMKTNNGVPVSVNEKLMSFIRNEKSAIEFTKLRTKYNDELSKLKIGNAGKDTDFFFKLIFFSESGKDTGSQKSISEYLTKISNDTTKFEIILKRMSNILDTYLTTSMLMSPSILFKSPPVTNLLVMLLIFMNREHLFSTNSTKPMLAKLRGPLNESFVKFVNSCDDQVDSQFNLEKDKDNKITKGLTSANLNKIRTIIKDKYKMLWKDIGKYLTKIKNEKHLMC